MAEMTPLLHAVAGLPELTALSHALDTGQGPVTVTGLSPVHRAIIAAALYQAARRPVTVLCADDGEARRMASDLRALTGAEPAMLLAREWRLREGVSASHEEDHRRLAALCAMNAGKAPLLVATVEGAMQRTLSPSALSDASLALTPGARGGPVALTRQLEASGYVRSAQVEGAGQYAVRGGIVDVWPPLSNPARATT